MSKLLMNYVNKIYLLCFNERYRKKHFSLLKLKRLKRFQPITIDVFENPISIIDSDSFLFQYNEIFIKNIYKFHSIKSNPVIIDGGSNIGLAIIYWKLLFPKAKIIGFEPDPLIFKTLKTNIDSFRFKDVQLVNKGLWNENTELNFISNGSDSGRIIDSNSGFKVKVVSLKDFLKQPIDFLKLDIEGAELEVLEDCKEELMNVDNLFIEYHSFENKTQNLDKILNIVTNSGFRYFIESVGICNPHPFLNKNINKDFDLQLNIYCFRPI